VYCVNFFLNFCLFFSRIKKKILDIFNFDQFEVQTKSNFLLKTTLKVEIGSILLTTYRVHTKKTTTHNCKINKFLSNNDFNKIIIII